VIAAARLVAGLVCLVRWATSTAALNSLADLLFLNSPWPNIGDATGLRGSTAAGVFYVSLHTADPGLAGSQSTSEVAYTGYARQAVTRDGTGWKRSGTTINPFAAINFPASTAGSANATYACIGTDPTGAGHLIASGAITPIAAATRIRLRLNGIIREITNGTSSPRSKTCSSSTLRPACLGSAAFAGSIPEIYERFFVPLLFEAYASDLATLRGIYDTLKNRGYNVAIVQNPTISLEDDVALTPKTTKTLRD
jgi:hypothetical protein